MKKWWKRIPWCKFLGAILLIGSWIAQNYLMAERYDEMAYLERAQILISIEEGHFSEWLSVLLLEQKKEDPNSQILKDSALKAAQHQLNIITWAIARVTNPNTHSKLLEDKDQLLKELEEEYEKNDPIYVIEKLSAITKFSNEKGIPLIKAANEMYADASSQGRKWNNLFLLLYLVGSILVGISVLIDWLKQD